MQRGSLRTTRQNHCRLKPGNTFPGAACSKPQETHMASTPRLLQCTCLKSNLNRFGPKSAGNEPWISCGATVGLWVLWRWLSWLEPHLSTSAKRDSTLQFGLTLAEFNGQSKTGFNLQIDVLSIVDAWCYCMCIIMRNNNNRTKLKIPIFEDHKLKLT